MSVAKDFKEFVLRGNVVDLAVGVVIGAAFGAVIKAFVADLLTPLIGIAGKRNFADLAMTVNGSVFLIGDFVNTVVSFLLVAGVVFFLVVRPVNWLMSRRRTETAVTPSTRECPQCLSSIPVLASRCAFCTSEVALSA